jgi:hypothetical protein
MIIAKTLIGNGAQNWSRLIAAAVSRVVRVPDSCQGFYRIMYVWRVVNTWSHGASRPDKLISEARQHGSIQRVIHLLGLDMRWDCCLVRSSDSDVGQGGWDGVAVVDSRPSEEPFRAVDLWLRAAW